MNAISRVAACVWFLVIGGCQGLLPVTLDTTGVRPGIDYSDLALVLHKAQDKKGFLDVDALKKYSAQLDSQLKRLAVTGPGVTPNLFTGKPDRLAYWYNARAAWAMKLALLNDCPQELSVAALEERPFPLDGRRMTLAGIDGILKDWGDWRVLAAAPGVRLNRARLPKEPLSSETVEQEVPRRLADFLDDEDRVVVDVEQRQIQFPPVLWQYRAMLIEQYERNYHAAGSPTLATALLPYLSGSPMRRMQDAIGYQCVEAPADRPLACQKQLDCLRRPLGVMTIAAAEGPSPK